MCMRECILRILVPGYYPDIRRDFKYTCTCTGTAVPNCERGVEIARPRGALALISSSKNSNSDQNAQSGHCGTPRQLLIIAGYGYYNTIIIRKNADFATKFRPMTRIHHKSDILLKIPNNDQH
jgi:hypothetical protein